MNEPACSSTPMDIDQQIEQEGRESRLAAENMGDMCPTNVANSQAITIESGEECHGVLGMAALSASSSNILDAVELVTINDDEHPSASETSVANAAATNELIMQRRKRTLDEVDVESLQPELQAKYRKTMEYEPKW